MLRDGLTLDGHAIDSAVTGWVIPEVTDAEPCRRELVVHLLPRA
jgi:hypothetical protein